MRIYEITCACKQKNTTVSTPPKRTKPAKFVQNTPVPTQKFKAVKPVPPVKLSGFRT